MTMDQSQRTAVQLAVTSAALDGDAAAVYHLVSDLMSQGMPFDAVLFEVLAPVQSDLGERWRSGDYLISEEHAATGAVDTVLAMLAGSFEQPAEGLRVVIACVEGDQHALPGRFLAALLLYRGLRTTYLGATMPAADLERYLVEDPPDVLVLTCSMPSHLPGARLSIAAGHAAGLPVMVGGGAFGPEGERATRLGADHWAPSPLAAADTLESWEPGRRPRGTAQEPPAEYASLIAGRPAIVAAAATFAAGSPQQSSRHHADLELMFDALLAAMLADDDVVFDDVVGWLVSRPDGSNAADAILRLIEALQDAVGDGHPATAYRLATAEASLAGS